MIHQELQELLQSYADDELSGREREEIEKHLADCSACRSEAQSIRKANAFLKEALQPFASHQIAPHLTLSEIKEKSRYKKGSRRLRSAVMVASVIIAALLAAVLFRGPMVQSIAPAWAMVSNLLSALPEANPNLRAFIIMLRTFLLLSIGGGCLMVFYITLSRNDFNIETIE